ncbi:hypothetical protein BKA58DRAFT_146901 [Alternaria rosae]|uniref:uncharacterized protein n=1 Tax=Alternaria rosae TaxID=1187941 RepID=UPI001E8DE9C1|nr:uncharacterized protein BKA58DRAFT_146901 [Alternaria rosae]KAH6872480.1 hypothetical protein BKA58DRAFT_146901 [Alternaria rosae]
MAPSHTTGNSCQTIDLTGSSPEPEQKPQQRSQQRPQPRPPQKLVQMYLKPEPRPYGMANVGMEARHPMTSARNPVGAQQARPIHPEHIKQIIETADPRAVQRVLLELCQMSPAFSGALVRGLASHSASAQGLISQQRMQLHQPKVKIPDEDDSDELYEATKRKLAKSIVPTPNHNSLPAQSREISGSRATSRPHGSEFESRVKREPRERSESSSDGDMHLPGAYPRSTTLRTPVRKPSGQSSSVNQTPRLLTRDTPRSASINKRPAPLTKTCTVCHEQIVDVNAPCVTHSGQRYRPKDGLIKWDCCHEDIDHPGCEFYGQHTTGEELEEDALVQRKRPSASPGPSRATQKRPRAF